MALHPLLPKDQRGSLSRSCMDALPQTGDRSCSSPGKLGSETADAMPWRLKGPPEGCGKTAEAGQTSNLSNRGRDWSSAASSELPGLANWGVGCVRDGDAAREARSRDANSGNSGPWGELIHRRSLPGRGAEALSSSGRRYPGSGGASRASRCKSSCSSGTGGRPRESRGVLACRGVRVCARGGPPLPGNRNKQPSLGGSQRVLQPALSSLLPSDLKANAVRQSHSDQISM